jgi:hypothetical protein
MKVRWVDEEAVIVNLETGRIHHLSPTSAWIYSVIEEYGFDEGMAEIRNSRGNNPTSMSEVATLIQDMIDQGLLMED